MNELLKTGQVLKSAYGLEYVVGKCLGGGGQGEVYQVSRGSETFALKWYYQQAATKVQLATLDALIKAGQPADNFLWPIDLVTNSSMPSFGYVMGLRPPDFKGLADYVSGRVHPSAQALVTMGIELAKAMRSLHIKGMSYCDISFGNAFFHPKTGRVLICDNDNVCVNRSTPSILGTADFMAPEIVRGDAAPSRDTDYHSLAVLLFHVFFLGHPFMGKKLLNIHCWDGSARELLFGKEPVFIFDPNNQQNEAVPDDLEAGGNALLRWNIYPTRLRDTFTKAFTSGLRPDGRVTDSEWIEVLSAVRDSMFPCNCGTPNYFEAGEQYGKGSTKPCWHCGSTPPLPYRLHVRKSCVMLNAETKLHAHHIGGSLSDIGFQNAVAEVVPHPQDPKVWGLKNLTPDRWTLKTTNGEMKDVEPGRSAPLVAGNKIHFGKVEGEILY